jgi:DNA-binding GntR family transcriptional regulator
MARLSGTVSLQPANERRRRMKEPALRLVPTKSLADQVADSIVEGIAIGAIGQGQRLMEVDLANQLQVSRVPVREALKILQAQGIVVSRPHYGVRVARYDEEKIVQIYEVRCNLEKIAIRDACKRRHVIPSLFAKLDAIIGKMETALTRNDFIGVSKADLEFHHEICRASGNEIALVLWEALSRHLLIVFEQELLGDAEQSHIVDHHRALRDALERLPPQELADHIERHIMRLRGKSDRLAMATTG